MTEIQERGSTHVYKVNRISKEEIDYMTNLCVHEQPPYCNATCPLKVDVRSLMQAVSDGNWKKAMQIYDKAAPFPIVLSEGCDAPCECKCKLLEIGEGIAIRRIEQAVAKYAPAVRASMVFRTKKKKKAVIFGSGAFALFLAGEMEKKSYPVTVICSEGNSSEFLKSAAPFLNEEKFALELARLDSKDIQFEFNTEFTRELYDTRRQEFDLVAASAETAGQMLGDVDYDIRYMYNEVCDLIVGDGNSVLEAAYAAKKAALTADRLAQSLTPDNMRGNEGSEETRLFTSLAGVEGSCRITAGSEDGSYSMEEAISEASRCISCHCEECFKGCAYLQHYKKHPGQLSREIYNNTQIIMGDHPLNKTMNACSLCGQCKVLCPNGFDMGQVCHRARANMVSTDKMPLAPHEFALMDMMFSNNEAYLSRPQVGFDKCKYVFFPGCQAGAIAPETVIAAYEDLCTRLEGGVAIMLGCCGAICDWSGRYEMYDDVRAFIDREMDKLGNPVVIAGCPTCEKELKGHENMQVVGITDILCEIGLPQQKGRSLSEADISAAQRVRSENERTGACAGICGEDSVSESEGKAAGTGLNAGGSAIKTYAVHDSCGTRGDEKTRKQVRQIMEKMGYTVVDTPYSGDESPCCGYGGLASYANREVAGEMTRRCLERSDEPYVSYCMACRDRFAREGRVSRHILELVYGTDAGTPPDISEKRYNRLTLRRDMLKEFWNEDTEEVELGYELEYTEEALRMMDDRMILKSDVIEVLDHFRETDEAIEDADTGYLMACKRCQNVTFWVAFTENDNGYLVHRAYSHRMTVEKRLG